ncbi:MAG TPA: isoprenylcysteine carboxylmethyltransferase family protein [Rhizomicrobium sp.]|jgi:protein-S-isoprenylcysteine O-methyltransferase Ste14|nr:isoprenylcysteine carboxylmethyltransferase family protein [Rhizomicrobium sp.]
MLNLIPPVWAAIYLGLAGAASAIFPWRTTVDLRIAWFGVVLIAAGAAFAVSAALLFRAEETEISPTSQTNRRLVIRGPYRLTRNPMYLGLVLASLGIAFCVGSLPMFAAPLLNFATTNQVHIPFEEARMRRQFGQAYDHPRNAPLGLISGVGSPGLPWFLAVTQCGGG